MKRLKSLADLAPQLPAHPTLVMHSGCALPRRLSRWLADEAEAFAGATVYTMMPMGAVPFADPPASDVLSNVSFFPGAGLRAAASAGRVRVLRHPLSALPGLFVDRTVRADALFLQVTPPDGDNRVSLGLSVDYMRAVVDQAPLIVAEINPALPRTRGASMIDADRISFFIDADGPPDAVPPAPGDAIDARIAQHVAALVEDGAVLQIGIGSLPDRILGALGTHHHLGVHTGIITDAVRPLIESGAVSGVTVTTLAAGTQAFYDFLDANDAIAFHPCSLTHDVERLKQIAGLTAINSALQIDLGGRVNAESVGGRVIAAPGGLPDFSRGARLAPRGRGILALRATHKGRSNIVAALAPEAPVTLSPADIDIVVTEYGIARCRDLPPVARAEALIALAAPEHQEELARGLATLA